MYEKEIITILKKKKEPLGIYEIVKALEELIKKKVVYNTIKMTLKDMSIDGKIKGKAIGEKQRCTWIFWLE